MKTSPPARRDEVRAGVAQGAVIGAVVLALAAPLAWRHPPAEVAARAEQSATAAQAATAPVVARVDFDRHTVPDDVASVAGWAVSSGDHGGLPFALIDKQRTQLYVFGATGRLLGTTPVLLGHAPGDDTVPGIGQRPIEQVQPHERTTPAGRFEAAPGRNLLNEDVVWVDYDAAVSMHRVRATNPAERRLERLASLTTADNRISYGCINVPVAFFEQTVWPTIGAQRAVVYVLPEIKPLQAVFPRAATSEAAARRS